MPLSWAAAPPCSYVEREAYERLRSLSMHPSQVAAVKQRVLRADTQRLTKSIGPAIASDDPEAAWAALMGRTAPRTRAV